MMLVFRAIIQAAFGAKNGKMMDFYKMAAKS